MRVLLAILCFHCLFAGAADTPAIRLINPYPATGLEEVSGRTPANKVLRIMQDYAAPSVADGLAWAASHMLAAGLSQPVDIDRRPRRGGAEGREWVAQAAPDGRTLLLSDAASMIGGRTQRGTGGARELLPVALIAEMPMVLIVGRHTGADNLKALAALAHKTPGRLHLGAAAEWSTSHLASEHLKRVLAMDMLYVPYNGGAAAVGAVLKGQIEAAVVPLPAVLGYTNSTELRVIALSGTRRHPVFAAVPTFGELGVKGLATTGWFGLFAPKGTAQASVDAVNRAIAEGVRSELVERLVLSRGLLPDHRDAAAFSALLRLETERWGALIAAIGAAQGRS